MMHTYSILEALVISLRTLKTVISPTRITYIGQFWCIGNVDVLADENKSTHISIHMNHTMVKYTVCCMCCMSVAVIDGIPDSSLASIADNNNEVRLTVVASDDPYGKFAFTAETKSLTIAEDFYPGQESSTKAIFTVERRQGIFGNVEVDIAIFCI